MKLLTTMTALTLSIVTPAMAAERPTEPATAEASRSAGVDRAQRETALIRATMPTHSYLRTYAEVRPPELVVVVPDTSVSSQQVLASLPPLRLPTGNPQLAVIDTYAKSTR